MAPPPPELPALDNTYGAMLTGTYLGLILYGVTVHQTSRYWGMYPGDPKWIKALVSGIIMLETFHTFISVIFIYHQLVVNYGNPLSLSAGHWTTRTLTPTTGISIILCQSFYTVRVYRIERRCIYRLLVGAAAICMVASLGFTIAATIEGSHGSLDAFKRVSWLVGAMFGFALLADVCLAGTLVVVLLRSRTGFKPTDSLIYTLIIYTINTGLLTSMVGLPCFVFAVIIPGNLIYGGISIVGVKLYANSVLAVLNSRRSLSDRMFQGFEDMASFELNPASGPGRGAEIYRLRSIPTSIPRTTNDRVSSRQGGVSKTKGEGAKEGKGGLIDSV